MSKPLKLLVVMGTRPEIIKLASIVHEASNRSDFEVSVCHSGQHYDLAQPMLDYFHIEPDINLSLMEDRPTLTQLAANCMLRLESHLVRNKYDAIIVQGDTTTCAAASLAGFYTRTPVVHVEAGLRTGDLQSPWPEELNRRIAALSSSLHCAATKIAEDNLIREGIPHDLILVTGNTVIDALHWAISKEELSDESRDDARKLRPTVILTAHRRENFGEPLKQICRAVLRLADAFPIYKFIFVTHPNPNAGAVVRSMLSNCPQVELSEPMSYQQFVREAFHAKLIISDSGGVQEEAPTLGVPLLITRQSTERPEAVHCGSAKLVGTEEDTIFNAASELLSNPVAYAAMTGIPSPFGDGQAAKRILDAIQSRFSSAIDSADVPDVALHAR